MNLRVLLTFFFLTPLGLVFSIYNAEKSYAGDEKSEEIVNIYVSTAGNDAWSGTLAAPNPEKTDGPLATPEGARNVLRAMRFRGALKVGTPVTVTIQAGTYRQMKPLVFHAEDSGTVDAPVVFRAADGAKVYITGGIELPQPSILTNESVLNRLVPEVRGKIKVWNLPQLGISDFGVETARGVGKNDGSGLKLICNNLPQTLARWPDEGFIDVAGVPDSEKERIAGTQKNAESFLYAGDRPSRWCEETDPRGAGFWKHNWAGDMIAFEKIDPEMKTITQKNPGSSYGFGKISNAWYGYNLLCELDAPGEYYLNRLSGELYFYPPENEENIEPKKSANIRCAVTVGTRLMSFENVSFFCLEGVILENCRETAVKIRDGESVSVVKCIVRNTGCGGIEITGGSRHRVSGCDIAYIDGTGLSLSGGDAQTLTHSGHTADNNYIHHFSRHQMTYNPAIRVFGCGNCVTHNLIHDGPHVAVLFGGRENRFEFNEVHSVCLNSGEMGAFYCGRDWTLVGNVLNGNYIHDIYNPRGQRNRAMMLDDGAAGMRITNNLIVRVAEGISLSAVGNVVENNIFSDCHPAISCWQKWENPAEDYTNPHYTHAQLLTILAQISVHEKPWSERYPWLAALADSIQNKTPRSPETRTVIRGNILTKCDEPWIQFMTDRYAYSPKTWLVEGNFLYADAEKGADAKKGSEADSDSNTDFGTKKVKETVGTKNVAEIILGTGAKTPSPFTSVPGDAVNPDAYALAPSCVPVKEGFQPLSYASMGLYASPDRASWPVKNEVNKGCGKFTYGD